MISHDTEINDFLLRIDPTTMETIGTDDMNVGKYPFMQSHLISSLTTSSSHTVHVSNQPI